MSNNSFSQLKSSRKSLLEKLTGELTKMQSGSQQSNGPDGSSGWSQQVVWVMVLQ